jgi:CubicO group peptidase (beta-lactamase class C family)
MNKDVLLTILVLAIVPGSAAAQLPDSPTGRAGNTLIQLFSSGPSSVTSELMRETFGETFLGAEAAEKEAALREAVAAIGSLELRGVEKTGPFSATIRGVSSLSGERIEIAYEVDESDPHGIIELTLRREPAAPREKLTTAQFVAKAEALIDGLSTDVFSGTVLVARGEEVLLEMAHGLASRRYGVPNTVDTRFNLGSINKLSTKIAIAQLAAQGKLSFEDRVAEHLRDYPNREVAERITIQQVATHTAGLGDIFTAEFAAAAKERFESPQDYFTLFAKESLLFEPGTSERYSNGGYMVLGAIIEAVSGQSYDDYVREHIFAPAGMDATGSFAMSDPVPDLAAGYTRHGADHHAGPGAPGRDATPWQENSHMIPPPSETCSPSGTPSSITSCWTPGTPNGWRATGCPRRCRPKRSTASGSRGALRA